MYRSGLWTILCIAVLNIIHGNTNIDRADTQYLKLVSLLYRHGDRSPIELYPNDPNTADAWPQGLGQLTKLGIQQGYELGTYLRGRYDGFLSDTYDHEQIYALSMDVDRCLMTAQAVLAGLYPPGGSQVWNTDLSWQPIPVHTTPKRSDQLLWKARCPKLDKLRQDVFYLPAVYNFVKANYKEMFESLHQAAGYDWSFPARGDIFGEIKNLVDTLYIENFHNMTIPSWMNTTFLERLKTEVVPLIDYVSFYNTQIVRLTGGQLIHQIVTDMRLKKKGILKQDMFMYSAHDNTVLSLLAAIHSYQNISVKHTGVVMLELHGTTSSADNTTQYSIRVYYKNGPTAPTQLIQLPGCSDECSYDTFVEITKDTQLADRYQACNLDDHSQHSHMMAYIIAAPLSVVLVTLVCGGSLLYYRQRARHNPYRRDTLDLEDNDALHYDDSDGSIQLEPMSILPPEQTEV